MITGPYRMYCSLVSTISILFISVMAMASFLDLRGIAAFDEGQETETHKFEHLQRSIEGGIKVWLWSLVGVKKQDCCLQLRVYYRQVSLYAIRYLKFESLLMELHFWISCTFEVQSSSNSPSRHADRCKFIKRNFQCSPCDSFEAPFSTFARLALQACARGKQPRMVATQA